MTVAVAVALLAAAWRLRPPPARVRRPTILEGRSRHMRHDSPSRTAARRRAAEAERELPEVVDLLVLAVGAGLTVPQALAAVARRATGPLGSAVATVVSDTARGRRLADALDDLPMRAGEAARPLAAALAACERYGAPVADALDRLAVEARDRQRRRAEQAARRVPVLLLFPLVLCILPAFALLAVAPLLADAVTALRP